MKSFGRSGGQRGRKAGALGQEQGGFAAGPVQGLAIK